ncbi:MAG: Hsp70 family protein, partial [Fimbriiglobus sp.]
ANIVIGIDLGTTFSVVGYLDANGRPATALNAEGDLTTPSVVFLDKSGAVVGKEAVKAAEFEPDRIARHPKRDMGQAHFRTPVRGEQLPPEVLQAVILGKLKADAEAKLGPITRAVITVPAYFNEPRRRATQDAGRMAGLDVIDIINEPTAAAICHGVQRGYLTTHGADHPAETVLVYDLGGGTFDVTLMRVERNCFTVLATAGDVELGGIDWDTRLIDFLAEKFLAAHGVDPRLDPHVAQRLRDDAEEAKRTLTTRQETVVSLSFDGKRSRIPVTRAQFEELTADLLDRTVLTLRRLMKDAGQPFTAVTRLLAVGGSTRMPMVSTMLERETGLTFDRSLSADEAVAHGAAIYAASKADPNCGLPPLMVKNVCSHDLGILGVERATGMPRRHVMIKRNSPLPAEASYKLGTFRDNQQNATVNVIEGGDAGGKGATPVGKCHVRDLPKNLPKNTPIEVTFRYAENGRLEVSAQMPTIGKSADTTVERAGGMAEDQFAGWIAAVRTGLPDGYARPGAKPEPIRSPAVAAAIPAAAFGPTPVLGSTAVPLLGFESAAALDAVQGESNPEAEVLSALSFPANAAVTAEAVTEARPVEEPVAEAVPADEGGGFPWMPAGEDEPHDRGAPVDEAGENPFSFM